MQRRYKSNLTNAYDKAHDPATIKTRKKDFSPLYQSLYQSLYQYIRLSVMALALGAASTVPAMAAAVQMPALIQPANQEHHVGKVIFVELVTPDLVSAEHFYSGLFGWTFQATQDTNTTDGTVYAQAYKNGYPVAGLIQKSVPDNEHRQSAWLSFIAVKDVDATRAAAVQHGAKVLIEPRDVPIRGRQAVFADPQGAVFAVLASSSGDPVDVLAEPGEWIWSSLITRDPDAGAAFYQDLFNYEIFELPANPGKEHLIMASENYARASANSLPSAEPNRHSHWLNYVRVVDAVAMAAKVKELGGHVLVEPRVDRHGGKVAVVSDPSGAPFGLLEWTGDEMKEVTK